VGYYLNNRSLAKLKNYMKTGQNSEKKWYRYWWVIIIWIILGIKLLPFLIRPFPLIVVIGRFLIYPLIEKFKNLEKKAPVKTKKGSNLKQRLTNILILGGLLFVIFGIFDLGLIGNLGLVSFNLGRLIAFWILVGMLCAHLAYKKNKSPEQGFFLGAFFNLFALIYYLVCKKEISEKERKVQDWEIEKKYKKMLKEKAKKIKE